MDIIQIVSVGIIGAIITVSLKKYSPEISLMSGLATGVVIILFTVTKIGDAIGVLKEIVSISGIESFYLEIVLKVIAISYIAEFGVQLCNDAGVSSVASKIELAGKVLIMAVSAPVMLNFLKTVMDIV